MGLDMCIIRKRKQKLGKAKIFPFEKPFVRYYYKDGKSIDLDFPKNNHFVYKASKVKRQSSKIIYIHNNKYMSFLIPLLIQHNLQTPSQIYNILIVFYS